MFRLLHFVCSELRRVLVRSSAHHWRRAVCSGQLRNMTLTGSRSISHHSRLREVVVVILPVHISILLNPFLTSLPTD